MRARRGLELAVVVSACGGPSAPRHGEPAVTVAPAPVATAEPDAGRAPPPPPEAAARDAAVACEPLHGADVRRRGSESYAEAKTPRECLACRGAWGPHGIAGIVGCLCGTPDAGKACDGPGDCVAECVVDEPGAQELAHRCPAVGATFPAHCAPYYTSFGCHGVVVEKTTPAGPLRGVDYLCLD